MKKLLQSPLSRKFIFAMLAFAALSVAIIGCIKTENEPKKVSNKIKIMTHYGYGGTVETVAHYKYNDKDNITEIKHYLPNSTTVLKEILISYNSSGFLSEYKDNFYYLDGKTYKYTWAVTATDASGRPKNASETRKSTTNTTDIYTYSYTHNNSGQLITKRSNTHSINYPYTYHSDGKLKTFGLNSSNNPIQYDSNHNVKRYGTFPEIFEYNDILAPNWFLFDGNSHYINEIYTEENDKALQKYLRTGDSFERSWIYEYDDYRRPIKVKMSLGGYTPFLDKTIEYID